MNRPRALLLALPFFLWSCDGCDEEVRQPATTSCDAPSYGSAALARVYAVTTSNGEPALLSADSEGVLARASELTAALSRVPARHASQVRPEVAVVTQGDAWGAAARLRATGISSPESQALLAALDDFITRFALPSGARFDSVDAPPIVEHVLASRDGWRELDTEHVVLTHERLFGLRRVFRLFVRGDHEARALASQLVALDDAGAAYLSRVAGEIELLELDEDGPARARVFHLDRAALACGELLLREETEVRRIPDLGADDFLLDLGAPQALTTMPCARCHEDRDAFSLPTHRTSVADRLSRLLSRAEEDRRAITLVARPTAAQ